MTDLTVYKIKTSILVLVICLLVWAISYQLPKYIKLATPIDFANNTSGSILYSALDRDMDNTNIVWTIRTMNLIFENNIVEVNIGLRNDGTFVWRKAEYSKLGHGYQYNR
jgi:hypothetical protein